ncbi:hypothetical protein FRC17_001744 [Serendipita sp. 399]|nr:hypothetical protein FRC17_001744 [Serendipita sp. 399]
MSGYKATSRGLNRPPYAKSGLVELEDAFQDLQISSGTSIHANAETSVKDVPPNSPQPRTASPTPTHAKFKLTSRFSPITKRVRETEKSPKSVRFDPHVVVSCPWEGDKQRHAKAKLKRAQESVPTPTSLPIITPINEESISNMFDKCMKLNHSASHDDVADLPLAAFQLLRLSSPTADGLSDTSITSDASGDLWVTSSSSSESSSPQLSQSSLPSTPPRYPLDLPIFNPIPKTPVRGRGKSSGKVVSQKSIAKAAKKPYKTDRASRRSRSRSPQSFDEEVWAKVVPTALDEEVTPSSPTRVPFGTTNSIMGSSNTTILPGIGMMYWPYTPEDNFYASALDQPAEINLFSSLPLLPDYNHSEPIFNLEALGRLSLGPTQIPSISWSEEMEYPPWVY